MKMVEISLFFQSEDDRDFGWIRRATVAAARSLGLYARGKDYTDREALLICDEMNRLFPRRGNL